MRNLEFGHNFLRFHAADVGHKHLQNAVPMDELNMNGAYVTNAMKSRHIDTYSEQRIMNPL